MFVQNIRTMDACVVGAAVVLSLILRSGKKKNLPYPPGPPRYPIVGNIFQVPSNRIWETAAEWAKKYGDLIYLDTAGMPVLVINSYETAMELANKRSSIYSSRPHIIMACELEDWDWKTSLVPYGDELRRQRQYLHKFFNTSEALNYHELQAKETLVMLKGILEHPEDYEKHVRRLPAAVILMNVYGHHVKDENDKYIQMGEASSRSSAEANNYYLLDFIPWLKHIPEWFPGGGFHTVAKAARQLSFSFRNDQYRITKAKLNEGTAKECMASMLINEYMNEDGTIRNEQSLVDASATAYLGGASTSVTAIMTFILAMLKYPEVQRRAQEEVDAVIGKDRLPTFQDRDQLPYLRAVCTEVLRWHVVTPMPPPHSTIKDDEFKGYYIPNGTTVLLNTWAMSLNEDMYPEPKEFKPERWLPGAKQGKVPPVPPENYAFGYGRRVCPGQSWAEHIIFIAAASILVSFNIEKAIGPDGEPIPPNENYLPAFVRSLGPSKCSITPRSEKIASLIRQAQD